MQRARRYLEKRKYFEDVNRIELEWLTVDERVQDGHGTVGDTGIRVNLLED